VSEHVVVTGGAGYIGSFLTGALLRQGYRVTVIDDLLYGGESLLSYFLSLINISEPTRQAEISYAVFCLKKKKHVSNTDTQEHERG